MSNRKKLISDMLNDAAKGRDMTLWLDHCSEDFRHHNIHFKGDLKSLVNTIIENGGQFPNISVDIKHILEEGDIVMVHSHIKASHEHPGSSHAHIFKFKDDKIIEMWDFHQEVPESMVNEHGMF